MLKLVGVLVLVLCLAWSLSALRNEIVKSGQLTQELAQVKNTLEQEKKRREALEKINIELTQQAAVRAEENAKYREQLAQDTNPVLDGVVPSSVLRGLRSVRSADDSGRDSPTSAH